MNEHKLQTIQSRGIFHGLPTFPDELKGLTAMVAGANGISGSYVVKVLAESPERWSKVYALSRGIAPGRQAKQVEQIAVDFLKMSAQQIADTLMEHGAKADYVFFCAYLQPPADEGKSL